jgi:hypothetical protein
MHALVPPLHTENLFLRNTKISIFGGISKFLKLIVFGQILAVLGKISTLAMAKHAQRKIEILTPKDPHVF